MGWTTISSARTITWLRDTSWSSLLGHAYFLLFAGIILELAVPAAWRPYLSHAILAATLL
jgi:hypothetical protein